MFQTILIFGNPPAFAPSPRHSSLNPWVVEFCLELHFEELTEEYRLNLDAIDAC